MNYNTKSKSSVGTRREGARGFTIIEVVLVLAIAGLIFLIVFLALPALQRSQRDTQRRNDLGRATAALQQYQSNNRGSLPAIATFTGGSFTSSYLTNAGSTFNDPTTGSTYAFTNGGSGAGAFATPAIGQISVRLSATCGTGAYLGGGSRNAALVMTLETGGQYCQSI